MTADETRESRRKAREVALQVLYAVDQGEGVRSRQAEPARPTDEDHVDAKVPAPTPPGTPEETFEAVAEHFEMAAAAKAFARELALAVQAQRDDLDATVAAHARNWRVERMAVVDRNILRLATWELRFTETPVPIVLDEAVNLARRFGDDPSPGFVNGILDAIARDVRPSAS